MQKTVIGVVKQGNKVLVVSRNKNDGIARSFPSGTVEEGETEEQAVEREILEETNQKTKAVKRIGERPSPYQKDVLLVYWQCNVTKLAPIIPEKNKIDEAWYENTERLVTVLGDNIFQPVKDHLKI